MLPLKSVYIFGWKFVLNPDHQFNIKEHAVITIMSNLSFGQSWVSYHEPLSLLIPMELLGLAKNPTRLVLQSRLKKSSLA